MKNLTIIVDADDWLTDDGEIPLHPSNLRRNAIRMATFIEYGGNLPVGYHRETMLECRNRPNRSPCHCFMWVQKEKDGTIHAFCPKCKSAEFIIHGWKNTLWAEGPMDPLPPPEPEQGVRH